MVRRPPETNRLIRGTSHISFAVHMRELVEEKHFVYWSRRNLNNFFLKQESRRTDYIFRYRIPGFGP